MKLHFWSRNSVFLLRDPEISISDISTHILRPALVSQLQRLHEEVSRSFSEIVCFVSGRAKFVRYCLSLFIRTTS